MEENMKLLELTLRKLMQIIENESPGTTLTECAYLEAISSRIVQVQIVVTDDVDEFLEDFETKIVTIRQ